MGSVRLYPDDISGGAGDVVGTWENQAASQTEANILASLSDASTSTYVHLLTSPFVRVIRFENLAPGDIPTGARITGLTPYVQGKTLKTNTGAYFGGYVRFGSVAQPSVLRFNTNPFFYRWITYLEATTYAGSNYQVNGKGEQLTETLINNMDIRLFSTGKTGTYPNAWIDTKMRIYELYCEVGFDEKPVTSSVTLSNISDTPRPTVNWVYTDDLQDQSGFQVQVIRVSNGITAYDSGFVSGTDVSHELTKNLVIGVSYYARVRTAQVWNGPGGTFWSDWSNSANFTITVTPPPRATISVAQNVLNGRNDVTLSMSGWASQFTDGSTYVAIQGLDLPGVPNLTPAEWAALPGTNPALYASIFNAASAKFTAGFGLDNKWKFIEAKVVPNGASSVLFHDHTVKAGVARIYRTFTYKWNSTYGFLLTNQSVQDTYTGYAPQTITFRGAWMNAIEPATDPVTGAVIEFAYDSYQFRLANGDSDASETAGKAISTFNTSGYTFPTADFSNDEERSVEVSVALPDAHGGAEAEAALRKLNARKCPVDYRDQRGQRIRGIISSMKFQNTIWGKKASFTITAVGEQFEDNNLG